MGAFKFETKAIGALNKVAHKTQVAESGGLAGEAKLEYRPPFKPFGRATHWTLSGNQSTILKGASSMAGVGVSVKTALTGLSTLTLKYDLDRKIPSASLKFHTKKIGGRKWVNEVKVAKGKEVCIESEYDFSSHNKFQVETIGALVDALKVTHTAGTTQVKMKYIVPTKEPVLGLDMYRGRTKWDLEYNLKAEKLLAKCKLWPITLATSANLGPSKGFGFPTYKLTAERTFSF